MVAESCQMANYVYSSVTLHLKCILITHPDFAEHGVGVILFYARPPQLFAYMRNFQS